MSIRTIFFLLVFLLFTVTPKTFASDIKINEMVVHPGSGNKEWMEIYNPDKVDLSGYWIDDDTDFNSDSGSSAKKSLKDLQGTDTTYPYIELSSSMFNNSGDSVVLFSPDGTIVDQYTYEKDPGSDVSVGRSPDASGPFTMLKTSTKGSANSDPQPSPTVSPSTTPSPSPTPKITHTSTPSPTMKAVTTSSSYSISVSVKPAVATVGRASGLSVSPSVSEDAVLGSSTSATPTNSPMPVKIKKEKTKIAGMQEKKPVFPVVAVIACSVVLIGCGILVFLKIRKRNSLSS